MSEQQPAQEFLPPQGHAGQLRSASALGNAVLITWRRNRAYALRLVGDLAPEQFVAQPACVRGADLMNHPAWTLCHLALYARVARAIAAGEAFPDPIDDPFGMRSAPVADRGAYPEAAVAVGRFVDAHDGAEAALLRASDAHFALPNPLERQRAAHPIIGDMLVMLMVKHESLHLGQLSAWRRALGLARVAM